MTTVAIPAWTAEGVLPPNDATHPVSPSRSPYEVSLVDYVVHFGTTAERREVLAGYLRHRSALHSAGLTRGFQWLDGSFLEHVERLEGRTPNDVDVVTFFHLPAGRTQAELAAAAPHLLDHAHGKSTYRVDSYLVHLGTSPERLARQSAYWYSVWAHRRDRLWKGFVQVDLSPAEDAAARAALTGLAHPGAPP